MKIKTSMAIAAAALTMALGQVSFAGLLPANTTIAAAGVTEPTGGTVLANSGAVAFTSGTFSGTLQSEVIFNDPTNPNGPGFLTFTYLLTNDAGSTDPIERFTVGSFAGVTSYVDYDSPTAGQIPTDFTRSPSGSVIGADFLPPSGNGTLAQGATAALIVVQTNATGFTIASASVIDDANTSVTTFAPASGAPSPEPTTAFLTIPAVALLVRRRRRQS